MAAGLLALGAEMGVGCGGGGPDGGICGLRCDCEGCSDREYFDCLDRADADARLADRLGCYDFYDELLACENATARCFGDDFDTDCSDVRNDLQRCED